jgi:hypothetical protein
MIAQRGNETVSTSGEETTLEGSDGQRSRFVISHKLTVAAGAAVTALGTLAFMLLFWNRFIGLRSGDGGFTTGVFLLDGILPYRDYYCPVPPLFIARSAAVLGLFGKLPIVLRGTGVFERVVIGLLLYGWLARFFRAKDAALATLVTMIVSSGDYADPVSSYNHFTVLWAIASGLTASYALDEGRSERTLLSLGMLSGALAMLSFASKQTIGLGMLFAIPTAAGLILFRLENIRRAWSFLSGFVLGSASSVALLAAWMLHYGLLRSFLKQAFVQGPAAKVSRPGDFLLHAFTVFREQYWWAALMAVPVLVLWWISLRKVGDSKKRAGATDSLLGVAGVFALSLLSVLISWRMLLRFSPSLPAKPTIYASEVGSALLLIYYCWRLADDRLSRKQAQLGLIAVTGFVVAFMTSLSFPVFELMTLPGLALIIVVLLDDYEDWRRWALYAVCGALMFCQVQAKMQVPYGFDNWYEPPVNTTNTTSAIPELRGFKLAPNTIDFVDSTVRIVRENSTPSDTIFTYPEMGIFYGLTGRRPATVSGSHNFDTVSDAFAKEEATRLLQARPAVLIFAPPSEQMLRVNEEFWRGGNRSGQRDLIAAAGLLAREYRLAFATRLYPYGDTVYVFVRPPAP